MMTSFRGTCGYGCWCVHSCSCLPSLTLRYGRRRKRSSAILRTVEIEAGKGIGIADACRKLGIT